VHAVLQEPPALRLIIAFSAAATLLYTPVLKRLTLVKNLAVAAVIALTPLTGALALGVVSTQRHTAMLSLMKWCTPSSSSRIILVVKCATKVTFIDQDKPATGQEKCTTTFKTAHQFAAECSRLQAPARS
jgi:hypothetical protein